jgi:large subunit ribosomal protein L25
MSRPTLAARPRAVVGKHVAHLRRGGVLPGVVYGAGVESTAIEFDAHEFELLHRQTGRHAVVDLQLDGSQPQPVLLHVIQEHPISRRPIHVDFLAVNMQEERTVDVRIVAVGHSEAVERLGGVLLHLRDEVIVRAKPDDLPSSIELDITPLDTFEGVLHASDLIIPPGVTLVTDPSEPVARVQAPRIEEEPEVEPTVAPEGIEGEAGVEGEAAESTEES